jgi:hypothetical protein
MILGRIAAAKRDQPERKLAGRHLNVLSQPELPACAPERGAIMSSEGWTRIAKHPYVESSPETHGHFDKTSFEHLPYSAACVPFRWMLKRTIEGDAKKSIGGLCDQLRLGYRPEREPELPFETSWVQERENQLSVLDTFFSAVVPEHSLCFFYAKRTPMADDARRVIVGVGRVLQVASPVEYRYRESGNGDHGLKCMLWERNVVHSIRPGFTDGFLLPYHQLLSLAEEQPSLDLSALTVFAPDAFLST